ncbi:MAG: 50S ribosomal protein L11 methyltransferase [Acidobacteriota bacterium]
MADYELRSYTLPVNLEEQLTAELWSLGALGFAARAAGDALVQLDAYFPVPPPAGLQHFDRVLWHHRGVRELTTERFAERDWLADYRATVEPLDIGESFRIDPRDVTVSVPPEPLDARHVLAIPARTAFGTGSHESTRLTIEWLEAIELTGRKVLDVGTGSGILAFVALILGARRVVGFDIDAQAVCIARANAERNRLGPLFFAGGVTALRDESGFDVAMVNILPENVASEMPALCARLAPGARLISSGNLATRRDELLARWAELGFEPRGEKQEAEWVAWLLESRQA